MAERVSSVAVKRVEDPRGRHVSSSARTWASLSSTMAMASGPTWKRLGASGPSPPHRWRPAALTGAFICRWLLAAAARRTFPAVAA